MRKKKKEKKLSHGDVKYSRPNAILAMPQGSPFIETLIFVAAASDLIHFREWSCC